MSNHHHRARVRNGQLTPLRERLTDEQLRARAAKTEVRRIISVEHAKTRGLVNIALSSAANLHKRLRRFEYAAVIALLLLLVHAVYFGGRYMGWF